MNSVTSKNRFRLLALGACAAAAFGAPALPTASAQTAIEALRADGDSSEFVRSFIDALAAAAESTAEGSVERRKEVGAILTEGMAVDRMQAFMLAKRHREAASADEISEFEALFKRYIVSQWGDSIEQLVTRRIDLGEARELKPGDYAVRSKLYNDAGAERADIIWRVLDVGGEKKLVDVTVNGMSFSADRRAQFSAVVKNEGFNALLSHMRETLAGQAT